MIFKKIAEIKKKMDANPFVIRYRTDAEFKTHVSLYSSLIVNLLYVGVNVLSGVLSGSAWYVILACYFSILALMRFLLLRFVNKNTLGENMLGEWKRARACGSILTLINLSLSAAVLMMMYRNRGFRYQGIFIYVMAIYTFYITTVAIINMLKWRKMNSPLISTAKSIALASALVSMLSLETAMLSSFGENTPIETKRILIAATGAGISIIVLGLSSYIIIRSTNEIQKLKWGENKK